MIQEEPEVKMRIIGIIENKIIGALTRAVLKLKVSWFSLAVADQCWDSTFRQTAVFLSN